MNEQLSQFKQQLLQDPQLLEQFKAVSSSDDFASLAVQLGNQMGYRFTVEEIQAALAEQQVAFGELSDAQLDAVAGGGDTDYGCQMTGADINNCF